MTDKQTDPFGARGGSSQILTESPQISSGTCKRRGFPATRWTGGGDEQHECHSRAYTHTHTAAWRNGVRLVALLFYDAELSCRQVPSSGKLNTVGSPPSFYLDVKRIPCSTAAASFERQSGPFFPSPLHNHNAFLLYPLQTIRVVDA